MRATIRRTRAQEEDGSFDPDTDMDHATTSLSPTSLTPLRRSALGYRYRDAGMNLTAVAIVLLLVTLAVVVTFVL